MDLIQFNKQISQPIYWGLFQAAQLEYTLFKQWEYRPILSKNSVLKEVRTKDTCFVIGNGPSLKNVDLNLLVGRDVITVNKMIATPFFEKLQPKLHLVLDVAVLAEILPLIESYMQQKSCFTHFMLHRSVKGKISENDKAHFMYSKLTPYSSKGIRTDFTKPVSGFINVLPQAVECAIYMGYKKIVLLGNDFSFFAKQKETHFYSTEKKEVRNVPLYCDLQGCAIACLQYRWLYQYCEENHITLINATSESLLDELPRMSFLDFLEKENENLQDKNE